VGCTALWRAVGLPRGLLRGKGWQGTLDVDPSEGTVRLFTIEVTSDQTLGNWYHVTKPIHGIKNLVTVK
jgi:hypothetical protein